MRRRDFVGGLGSLALATGTARGQQSRHVPIVGVLWHAANADEEQEYLSALIDEFAQLGYFRWREHHLLAQVSCRGLRSLSQSGQEPHR